MLLPIKPICNAKKIRRDGTSPIFLQYCYSATNRTSLNTGINIPPGCWNNKLLCITKKLPPICGNYEHLNEELLRLKRIAEDLEYLKRKVMLFIFHMKKLQLFIKQIYLPILILLNTEIYLF